MNRKRFLCRSVSRSRDPGASGSKRRRLHSRDRHKRIRAQDFAEDEYTARIMNRRSKTLECVEECQKVAVAPSRSDDTAIRHCLEDAAPVPEMHTSSDPAVQSESQSQPEQSSPVADTQAQTPEVAATTPAGNSSSSSPNEQQQGKEFLDKYRVIGTLPEGSFGKIFVCALRACVSDTAGGHVPRSERRVAKRVHTNSRLTVYLDNEILALQYMNHENILKVEDVLRCGTYTYMITRKYDYDLYSFMYDGDIQWKDRPLLWQTRSIMKQLLSAVEYMHSKLLMHRDIKLENVFLNRDGCVVLGDLGTAATFEKPRVASDYGWIGTVTTNSPEMLAGDDYCEITDIWSCGLIMLDMLSKDVLPLNGSTRNPEKQLRRLIRSLSVCDEEFPDPPCKLFDYIDAVKYTHTPLSVPPLIRRMDLPADFEYPLVKMLTFDWHRRPGANELLALPLFSSTTTDERLPVWGLQSGALHFSSWKPTLRSDSESSLLSLGNDA